MAASKTSILETDGARAQVHDGQIRPVPSILLKAIDPGLGEGRLARGEGRVEEAVRVPSGRRGGCPGPDESVHVQTARGGQLRPEHSRESRAGRTDGDAARPEEVDRARNDPLLVGRERDARRPADAGSARLRVGQVELDRKISRVREDQLAFVPVALDEDGEEEPARPPEGGDGRHVGPVVRRVVVEDGVREERLDPRDTLHPGPGVREAVRSQKVRGVDLAPLSGSQRDVRQDGRGRGRVAREEGHAERDRPGGSRVREGEVRPVVRRFAQAENVDGVAGQLLGAQRGIGEAGAAGSRGSGRPRARGAGVGRREAGELKVQGPPLPGGRRDRDSLAPEVAEGVVECQLPTGRKRLGRRARTGRREARRRGVRSSGRSRRPCRGSRASSAT